MPDQLSLRFLFHNMPSTSTSVGLKYATVIPTSIDFDGRTGSIHAYRPALSPEVVSRLLVIHGHFECLSLSLYGFIIAKPSAVPRGAPSAPSADVSNKRKDADSTSMPPPATRRRLSSTSTASAIQMPDLARFEALLKQQQQSEASIQHQAAALSERAGSMFEDSSLALVAAFAAEQHMPYNSENLSAQVKALFDTAPALANGHSLANGHTGKKELHDYTASSIIELDAAGWVELAAVLGNHFLAIEEGGSVRLIESARII